MKFKANDIIQVTDPKSSYYGFILVVDNVYNEISPGHQPRIKAHMDYPKSNYIRDIGYNYRETFEFSSREIKKIGEAAVTGKCGRTVGLRFY